MIRTHRGSADEAYLSMSFENSDTCPRVEPPHPESLIIGGAHDMQIIEDRHGEHILESPVRRESPLSKSPGDETYMCTSGEEGETGPCPRVPHCKRPVLRPAHHSAISRDGQAGHHLETGVIRGPGQREGLTLWVSRARELDPAWGSHTRRERSSDPLATFPLLRAATERTT